MPFDPFGKLMEVDRYKQDLKRKSVKNALANALMARQINQEENALAEAMRNKETARNRGMTLEMISGQFGDDPERLQNELFKGGFYDEAGKVARTVGKPEKDSPYSSPIQTSQGWVSYNHRTGTYEPIKAADGSGYLPVSADPSLAGRKTGATEQAKVDVKKKASFPKVRDQFKDLKRNWDTVNKNIDIALDKANLLTTGPGSVFSGVPGSPAKDLQNILNTVKANIGFDKLQNMRDNSPTGGALGQVSELENRLLQSVQGSLEQDQSPGQLKRNLQEIKSNLAALRAQKEWAYNRDYSQFIDKEPMKEPPMAASHRSTGGGSQFLKSKYGLE